MHDDNVPPEEGQSDNVEPTPRELEAMRALSDELPPPPELEDRVVAALEERGLIRAPAWRRWLGIAAAAVLTLGVGFAAGRLSLPPAPGPAPEESPRFVLLLYDTPEREASRGPELERRLSAEYGAWAERLGRDGRFVAGDPIHGEGRMLRQSGGRVEALAAGAEAGDEIVVGYFMIRARDHAEAVEIARDCPHLKYDGGVLVRQVGFT